MKSPISWDRWVSIRPLILSMNATFLSGVFILIAASTIDSSLFRHVPGYLGDLASDLRVHIQTNNEESNWLIAFS